VTDDDGTSVTGGTKPDWPWRSLEEIDAELRRHGIDPESSPFRTPGIAGIPFGKNSEEARAIARIIQRADRERAAAKKA
jgi:hypothetical protein